MTHRATARHALNNRAPEPENHTPFFLETLHRRLAPAAVAALLSLACGLPALAVDTGGGGGEPAATAVAPSRMAPKAAVPLVDLNAARKLIATRDWDGAIKLLRVIVVQQPRNADALNLLGFSLRNKGEMQEAVAYYRKALKIAPGHLGANEYLGELYAMTGDMAKAKAQLAKLEKLCGNTSCEAYQDLAKAIAKA